MYKSPTVATPARVYTHSLRIYGQVHTPPQADLASVMNHARPFFPMTHCQIYKPGLEHPPGQEKLVSAAEFLIVPKETVIWIAEPEADALEVRRSLRNIYLLYGVYLLKGEVNVPANVRISDFMTRAINEKPFQPLYGAELRLPSGGQSLLEAKLLERFELVLVNLRKVAGVYDVSEDSSKPDLSGF